MGQPQPMAQHGLKNASPDTASKPAAPPARVPTPTLEKRPRVGASAAGGACGRGGAAGPARGGVAGAGAGAGAGGAGAGAGAGAGLVPSSSNGGGARGSSLGAWVRARAEEASNSSATTTTGRRMIFLGPSHAKGAETTTAAAIRAQRPPSGETSWVDQRTTRPAFCCPPKGADHGICAGVLPVANPRRVMPSQV